jgi:hypothetical protein
VIVRLTKRVRLLTALGTIVLVTATGCGSDTADTGSTGSGSSGDSAKTVTIKEPADGATINIPFTLSVDSKMELGTTDSGKNHVHLFFDGDDSKYEVVESTSMEITSKSPAVAGLEPGMHELDISLRNADHSAAGFDTHITVNVGGGGGAQPTDDGGTGGGGY